MGSNIEPAPRMAFISGPLDPTDNYFTEHYKPRIDSAVQDGHHFVVGPVEGIDTVALHYLLEYPLSPSRITVYMAHFEFNNAALREHFESLGVNVKSVGDASSTTRDRDAKMTEDSDYDILRYRTELEAKALYGKGWWPRVSNTEMNERRRKGITSQAYNLAEAGQTPNDHAESSEKRTSTRTSLLKLFKKT